MLPDFLGFLVVGQNDHLFFYRPLAALGFGNDS